MGLGVSYERGNPVGLHVSGSGLVLRLLLEYLRLAGFMVLGIVFGFRGPSFGFQVACSVSHVS